MSVPSDQLMQLVAGGAGTKGAPVTPPAPGTPSAGPVSAPMSTPEPKAGEKQNALINVSLAMDLLEQTLPPLGSETEEGQTVLGVLKTLSSKFGATRSKSKELVPAELMQLMQNLPQAGGASPEQKAMQGGGAAMPHPQMPGAAPAGAPGMPGGMPPMQ